MVLQVALIRVVKHVIFLDLITIPTIVCHFLSCESVAYPVQRTLDRK